VPATLQQVFDRLLAAYGPQHWWPGQSPLEVLVGAVLTQNTSWKNVERAIANLREADLLDAAALHALPVDELAELIRPAGYYRLKARRLRNVLDLVFERYGGSLEAMFAAPLESLREELLAVNGIGPETADAILLYAGGLPTFVVDAYTHRVLARHGWTEPDADYAEIQQQFHAALAPDARTFNEYHALLVRLGKERCRRAQADCQGCPLEDLLPTGGAIQADP
jgi:endonuclease-3 related protein